MLQLISVFSLRFSIKPSISSMANMLDNIAVRSIAKHRSKLMSLVESTKKRKKKKQKKWAVPPSNIEHLVFKKIPTSPIDPGPTLNGTLSDDHTNYEDTEEADEGDDSYDDLDCVCTTDFCINYIIILSFSVGI